MTLWNLYFYILIFFAYFAYMSRKRSGGNRRYRRGKSNFSWLTVIVSIGCVALICIGAYGLVAKADADREVYDSTASGDIKHIPDLEIARGSADWPVKRYEGFALAFDERRHTPVWVGLELLRDETAGEVARSNRFWTDEDVYGCATNEDYRNSGYDRGHMCPAADQKWSNQAMRDCFSFANMAPQDHALNSGAWSTLEKKERLWAARDSALVIVAGPIYSSENPVKIGPSGVAVPDAFFKVLLAPYLAEPRAIGFIYPNAQAPGNMQDYSMSVDKVEEITGLDFFSNLPDDVEKKVESVYSFTTWNRR